MNAEGQIYRDCKCGQRVLYDRDCPGCGAKSDTADELGKFFGDLVRSEMPDPAGELRRQLIEADRRAR